jgi:hypothetical protein
LHQDFQKQTPNGDRSRFELETRLALRFNLQGGNPPVGLLSFGRADQEAPRYLDCSQAPVGLQLKPYLSAGMWRETQSALK